MLNLKLTKMKKATLSILIFVVSLCIFPTTASAAEPIANLNKTEVPAEVKVMYERLEEIKNMDKSEMTRAEKKELRKEVRSIKSELRSSGNGVYLSVGAIIIIVLLLILLL
jgi:hypothetical protein